MVTVFTDILEKAYCGFSRTCETNGSRIVRRKEKKFFATFFSLAATFNCTFFSLSLYLMNIYRRKIAPNKSETIAIAANE